MTNTEATQAVTELVEFGMCDSKDEAVHFLVDAGEITLTQHEALLSTNERRRIYG
jgi:hypothetical protein